jgi:hypothetical protein
MQIEQVIAGVGGDTTAQAIQLRMRSAGQSIVQLTRLRAWDANGQNPIVVIDMAQGVGNGAAGARILIASSNFQGVAPDFTMTNLIPVSYFAAGSLTFESDSGAVYWRLSWGGESYTGSNAGQIDNDSDGNFGPAFPGPLPFETTRALRFAGTSSALSTTNAANYTLTDEFPTFTNNAGASGVPAVPLFADFDDDGDVDLDEAMILSECMSGPGALALPVDCAAFQFRGGDLFVDGAIDLRDAAEFQTAFNPGL